jgi:hypothetical protein
MCTPQQVIRGRPGDEHRSHLRQDVAQMTFQSKETAACDARHVRQQMPADVERSFDVRTRPEWGTLVDIHPNSSGMVDEQRLHALEKQLTELTDDPAAGDIVIVVSRVGVMTAGFMSLLAMIRPKLICQNRKLSLHGLRPECAVVLQDSGLENLVACAVHRTATDAAPMVVLDCALTARPRGSGRAALFRRLLMLRTIFQHGVARSERGSSAPF